MNESQNESLLKSGRPQLAKPNLFNVALIEPEIPQNTGNIGRTCVGTRTNLHLVGELGFSSNGSQSQASRAGLLAASLVAASRKPAILGAADSKPRESVLFFSKSHALLL